MLRAFSLGSNPYAGGQHRGIDIGGDLGATVHAAAGGKVTFVGKVPSSGLVVSIATADGYTVTLTHLGAAAVTKGSSIEEGAPVGSVGQTSEPEVDSPYVHLGIRVSSDENGYVDPLRFLPDRLAVDPSRPGLLHGFPFPFRIPCLRAYSTRSFWRTARPRKSRDRTVPPGTRRFARRPVSAGLSA